MTQDEFDKRIGTISARANMAAAEFMKAAEDVLEQARADWAREYDAHTERMRIARWSAEETEAALKVGQAAALDRLAAVERAIADREDALKRARQEA